MSVPAAPTISPFPVTPGSWVTEDPDRVAVSMPDGGILTYGELEIGSRRLASLLQGRGLEPGDTIALLMENRLEYYVAAWAAQRSGLYYTPVNWHLSPGEAAYILANCGAQALFTSPNVAPLAAQAATGIKTPAGRFVVGGSTEGFEELDVTHLDPPQTVLAEMEGQPMYYSSGTSGRPKGIRRPVTGNPFGAGQGIEHLMASHFGFNRSTVYLAPGSPLYHAAPLGWSMGTQRLGGRVVLLAKFDPIAVLETIEREHITHAQFVPTMFVRMLKLPVVVYEPKLISDRRPPVGHSALCEGVERSAGSNDRVLA